ncbi:MAG: ATP-binding protein [Scytolyngbya sp. HA4215-MV1]|jgi:serine/threonine-protein kinase RsbW|nr:ATP-binding protein [Scytolyngbya sp. HA4215-MV1]
MINKNRMQTKSTLTDLHQVLWWFNQLDHTSVPSDVWIQCQTALAEGFTNAVRHAHQGMPPETLIDIEASIQKDVVEIRIWDSGSQFDLNQTLQRMTATTNKDATGGRGLLLLHRIADMLSYSRTEDDRNCLLIVKQYSKIQ